MVQGRDGPEETASGSRSAVETLRAVSEQSDAHQAAAGDRRRVSSPGDLRSGARGGLVNEALQVLQDLRDYRKAKAQVCDLSDEFQSLFKRFLAASAGRKCLRLGFDSDAKRDFGSNWFDVKLSRIEEETKLAGTVSIDVEDEYFDAVFCTGLGRVSQPASLIAEARRVLKQAGQIWVEVPLCGPYLPGEQQTGTEYWRFTPDGLRVMLESFDEIMCSAYLPSGSALRSCSFFYGLRPAIDLWDTSEVDRDACPVLK